MDLKKSVLFLRNGINNKIIYDSIRHHMRRKRKEPMRKPVWEPMAPSKIFRINTKEPLDEEEAKQRQHFDNTFETNMRSIRQYLNNEFYLPTLEAGGLTHEQVIDEETEQLQLIQQNDRENQRVAQLRAQRLALQSQLLDQQLIVSHLQQLEDSKLKGKQLDQIVKQEIKRSETYITHENLESVIEEALANPISYDFAIDTEGNVHFDGSLHPYALRPSAIPETSSNTEEFAQMQDIQIKLQPKQLF